MFHFKIKHLDTDYHFIREKVQKGNIKVQYIPTNEQVADVFTKGLHSPMFVKHCHAIDLGSVLSLHHQKLTLFLRLLLQLYEASEEQFSMVSLCMTANSAVKFPASFERGVIAIYTRYNCISLVG